MDLVGHRPLRRTRRDAGRSEARHGRRLPAARRCTPRWPSPRLKAGKHVFCEKPIALKPADAERMVKTAAEGRQAADDRPRAAVLPRVPVRLQDDRQRQVRQAAGRAFQADHLRSRSGCPTSTIPKRRGGPMLDLHIHDAHFIRLVCGMPKAVQSVGRMRGEVVERFQHAVPLRRSRSWWSRPPAA